MYKLFFIAKNNMKKQKGDMITFFILTLISAFLIFDCASAIGGVGKILDERFDTVNGAHVLLINGDTDEEKECAEKAFKENEHITEYESTPILNFVADYKNKKDDEYSQFSLFAQSVDEEPRFLNLGIDQSKINKDDILLPLYLKGQFPVGDTFQIKLGDDVYDFNVAGYAEDPYFCSSVNITIYYTYMSQEMIDQLKEDHPDMVYQYNVCKGVVDESELGDDLGTSDIEHDMAESYKKLVSPYAEQNPEVNYLNYIAVNWDMMRGGSQFLPMIIMAVILLFAIIIMTIAIVIISFSIKNFIQRNMKNTGILEASGYTVKELRKALILQVMSIAFLGSMIGIVLAMVTFKGFGNIVSVVLGLSWNQPINFVIAASTIVGLLLVVYLVSRLVSRTYKKITVLDALRGGITTHNFKRNCFSFEKTPLSIPVILSLKDASKSMGRNIVLVLITAILTVSTLVGFGLYENFGKDSDKLVSFMGFELPEVYVSGDVEIGDELREMDGVDKVLGYYGIEPVVKFGDEKSSVYTYVYDDVDNAQNTRMLEGRLPAHDNEIIMTAAAAEDIGAKVGDVVELEFGTKKAEYMIVGLNQRMERMGRTIIMNMDAAEKIIPAVKSLTYNIYLKNGESFESIKPALEDFAESKGIEKESFNLTDGEKVMSSTTGTISDSLKSISVIIAMLTMLIVIFVESLVIRAKIIREWRGMGISKALGMTSGGLITQIMLSSAPAIIIGILLGALVSQPLGGKACVACFSLFGMKSMVFNLPMVMIIATGLGILAVALITSALLGMKVRKLKPIEMITEE